MIQPCACVVGQRGRAHMPQTRNGVGGHACAAGAAGAQKKGIATGGEAAKTSLLLLLSLLRLFSLCIADNTYYTPLSPPLLLLLLL